MMKFVILLLVLGVSNFCYSNPVFQPNKDSITVYYFLLEDCVISKNYTDKMIELYNSYNDKKVGFLAVFPNPSSNDSTMNVFCKTNKLPFHAKLDYYQTMTKKMDAHITPEVVVYDHSTETRLYKGRIDNRYASVGKRRIHVTSSELEDVLKAWTKGKPLPYFETQAVGCYIQLRKS